MQRSVEIIIGQTGSGKSYLANQRQLQEPRVLIASAGFPKDFDALHVGSFDELLDYLTAHNAFESHRPFRVQYEFKPDEFHLIFETAQRLRNIQLVLDEADRLGISYYDQDNQLIWNGKHDPAYVEAINRGRHYQLSLLFVALRPVDLPTMVRAQATKITAFRTILPSDVKWISDVVGPDADRLVSLEGPPDPPPHPRMEWTPARGVKFLSA